MLKRIMIVCGAVTILNSSTTAQASDSNFSPSSAYMAYGANEKSFNYSIDINALRHFSIAFKTARGEKWTKKEDGYRVSFQQDNIRYLVDYDKKGNWKSTIRIYDEHNLPEDVRREVRTNFLDYAIVTVTELQINKVLSYFVKLEDAGSLKTVRVINGEMDVVEDYVK